MTGTCTPYLGNNPVNATDPTAKWCVPNIGSTCPKSDSPEPLPAPQEISSIIETVTVVARSEAAATVVDIPLEFPEFSVPPVAEKAPAAAAGTILAAMLFDTGGMTCTDSGRYTAEELEQNMYAKGGPQNR
jgi:hypothetical protein